MADNNTIARPYARAAFELASEKGDLAKWSEALTAAKEVLADGQAVRFLRRPALTDDQRLGFLTDLFKSAGGKASILAGGSEQGNNFLNRKSRSISMRSKQTSKIRLTLRLPPQRR